MCHPATVILSLSQCGFFKRKYPTQDTEGNGDEDEVCSAEINRENASEKEPFLHAEGKNVAENEKKENGEPEKENNVNILLPQFESD